MTPLRAIDTQFKCVHSDGGAGKLPESDNPVLCGFATFGDKDPAPRLFAEAVNEIAKVMLNPLRRHAILGSILNYLMIANGDKQKHSRIHCTLRYVHSNALV